MMCHLESATFFLLVNIFIAFFQIVGGGGPLPLSDDSTGAQCCQVHGFIHDLLTKHTLGSQVFDHVGNKVVFRLVHHNYRLVHHNYRHVFVKKKK